MNGELSMELHIRLDIRRWAFEILSLKDKGRPSTNFAASEKLKRWLIWFMDSLCQQLSEPQGPLRLINCFVKWKIYSRQLEFYFTLSRLVTVPQFMSVVYCSFYDAFLQFPSDFRQGHKHLFGFLLAGRQLSLPLKGPSLISPAMTFWVFLCHIANS